MNKTIRTAIATAAVGGVLLAASPASAAVASPYDTNFSGIAINDASGWRMSNPAYDAEIANGVLRISKAVTSGSFGDQLFSLSWLSALSRGALPPSSTPPSPSRLWELQPGLRVTISPDNGEGGRAGFLVVEHTKQGMTCPSVARTAAEARGQARSSPPSWTG